MIVTRVGVRCDGHPESNVRRYRPSGMGGGRGVGMLAILPLMLIATMVLPRVMGGAGGPFVVLGLVGLVVFIWWRFRR